MDANTRKAVGRVNTALYNLGTTYHNSIPLQDIDAALTANGFNSLEEGIYCGRDGKILEPVGNGVYFCMTWHKMEVSGRYEIVAYVS